MMLRCPPARERVTVFATKFARTVQACVAHVALGVLAASSVASIAQPFSPEALTIPSGHPRVLFTTLQDLQRARTWYASNTYAPAATSAIDNAFVGLMAQSEPRCRTAIDLVLTNANYQLSPRLVDAVASDAARWIGEEAMLTYDWCHSYFTVGERETFRTRWNNWISILNAKSWGGAGMQDNNYYWGYMRNSILWGIASWGENTVEGVDKAREYLMHGYNTRFVTWMTPYYAQELKGGVPPEGTAYGRVMFDYHLVPFLTLRSMGEDPFERLRFWKESIYYTAYSMTPGLTAPPESPEDCSQTYPPPPLLPGERVTRQAAPPTWQQFPFADDERFSQCGYSGLKQLDYSNGLLTYANLWPNRDSGKVARLIARTVGQRASPWIRAYFADTEPAANFSFNQLPKDYFAEASRNLYTRSAWGSTASSLNFMFGRSPAAGHKHFDGGSFQWWRNGRWLSRESTGYVGSGESVRGLDGVGTVDVDSPIAHNTVLFEGRATSNGQDGLPEGNAQILRLYANSDFVYAAADLAPTFRYRRPPNPCRYDWPYAEHAVREMVFLRSIETLVLIDRLTGSGDSGPYLDGQVDCYQPFTGPRRTPAQVRRHVLLHGMGPFLQNNGWFVSSTGNERLSVFPLLPVGTTSVARTVNAIAERTCTGYPRTISGACQGNFRLDIGASGAATIEFVNVLHAGEVSGELPTVSLQEDGASRVVRVIKNGVEHTVRFQLGALPVATSISVGTSTVTPPTDQIAPLQPAEFIETIALDVDGDGAVTASTDGVLLARFLLGLTGDALIRDAVGASATRVTPTAVEQYLIALSAQLDIDGDGAALTTTDAAVIHRYLQSVRGAALFSGVTRGAARTAEQMIQHLELATGKPR